MMNDKITSAEMAERIRQGKKPDDYQRGWNDAVCECINILKIEYPLHTKNIEKILKEMVKK